MKTTVAIFCLLSIISTAHASDLSATSSKSCPNLSDASRAYLKAIKAGGSLARKFKTEVSKMVDSNISQDLYECSQIESVQIAKGASAHGGVYCSKTTYLVAHSLQVSSAGVEDSSSLLAEVTISGCSTETETLSDDVKVRFTHLK